MRKISFSTLLVIAALLLAATGAAAQQTDAITLSLSRDFGFSAGARIQGTFSMRVSGPDNLTRVEFLIDGQVIGEATQAPFRLQFVTGSYAPGSHTMSAIGYTSDGTTLQSNQIERQFLSAEQANQETSRIIIPIVAVIGIVTLIGILGPLLLGRRRANTPLGAQRNYGMLGGAICPKCNRPFVLTMFGLRLGFGRLERCPNCGKWSFVRRANLDQLRAAEQAELDNAADQPQISAESEQEKLKKELDDSRYQDI